MMKFRVLVLPITEKGKEPDNAVALHRELLDSFEKPTTASKGYGHD